MARLRLGLAIECRVRAWTSNRGCLLDLIVRRTKLGRVWGGGGVYSSSKRGRDLVWSWGSF